MTIRTYVSTTVRNDRVDDVLHALEDVDPDAIVASVNRSDAPDAPPAYRSRWPVMCVRW
jgi:hypothetical protein